MNWYKNAFNFKNFFKGVGISTLSLPFILILLNMSNQDFLDLWNKFNGDEQAVKQELAKALEEKVKFNYEDFSRHLKRYEGFKNGVYDDGRGNKTIGIGHMLTSDSKNIFQQLFGNTVNYDAVVSGKQQLTNQQVQTLANYDIDKHLNRARKSFPKFNTYPYYIQRALLNSVYRGDTGMRTIKLINAGKWREAAVEYLNRHDYMNAQQLGIPGIVPRMNANRDAFLRYARDLEKKY